MAAPEVGVVEAPRQDGHAGRAKDVGDLAREAVVDVDEPVAASTFGRTARVVAHDAARVALLGRPGFGNARARGRACLGEPAFPPRSGVVGLLVVVVVV